MADEFNGYNKKVVEGEEVLQEGSLIQYKLKKNSKRWSVKNGMTGKNYYLKIDELSPEKSMHDFLSAIKASESKDTITELSYDTMAKDIWKNGQGTFWINADKEETIKNTWEYIPPKPKIQNDLYHYQQKSIYGQKIEESVDKLLKKSVMNKKDLKQLIETYITDKIKTRLNEDVEFALGEILDEVSEEDIIAAKELLKEEN